MMTRLISLAALMLFAACGEPATKESRILLMGDSLLAFHKGQGRAVSHAIEAELSEPVTDRAVSGARFFYSLPISGSAGLNIMQQYRDGPWDWVVLNGGGNDIWMGCGCGACGTRIDQLVSEDGRTGRIPGFVSTLRATGAQVIFVGYLRTPGVRSPIEGCGDEGDEMDRRLTRLAALDAGVHFLPLADLVPHGDRSYHSIDLIHPSQKASREIGARVAGIIARNE